MKTIYGLYNGSEGKLFYGVPFDLDLTIVDNVNVFNENNFEKFGDPQNAEYKRNYYIEFIKDKQEMAIVDAKFKLQHGYKTNSIEKINNLASKLISTIEKMQVVNTSEFKVLT